MGASWGLLWGRLGAPGGLLGTLVGLLGGSWGILGPRGCLLGVSWGPLGIWAPKAPPKSPQEVPKRLPRDSQKTPRATQEAPKKLREGSGSYNIAQAENAYFSNQKERFVGFLEAPGGLWVPLGCLLRPLGGRLGGLLGRLGGVLARLEKCFAKRSLMKKGKTLASKTTKVKQNIMSGHRARCGGCRRHLDI